MNAPSSQKVLNPNAFLENFIFALSKKEIYQEFRCALRNNCPQEFKFLRTKLTAVFSAFTTEFRIKFYSSFGRIKTVRNYNHRNSRVGKLLYAFAASCALWGAVCQLLTCDRYTLKKRPLKTKET